MRDNNESTKSTTTATTIKNASLLALVLQQVGLVLMIRYSRTNSNASSVAYITSTAVVTAEILKVVLNLSLEIIVNQQFNLTQIISELTHKDSLFRLLIPALAYVVQNNLLFVALSNLSVPIYQVSNQGKLLTTALCSRILLRKQITRMQYFSLVVLAGGVALVNLSGKIGTTTKSSSGSSTSTTESDEEEQNQLLGLTAVIVSCFTSGFAGVYFEKMLKTKKSKTTQQQEEKEVSVYIRNVQLAMWSVLLGLGPVIGKDWNAIFGGGGQDGNSGGGGGGFFQGYNVIVWGVIVCQAMTGLIVALVMKYADTILKGFATSVAVVVATVISIFIWKDTTLDLYFVIGAFMVVMAVRLYTSYPAASTAKVSSSSEAAAAAKKEQQGYLTNYLPTTKRQWSCVALVVVGIMQIGFIVEWQKASTMFITLPSTSSVVEQVQVQKEAAEANLPLSQEASAGTRELPSSSTFPQDPLQCNVRDISNYTGKFVQHPNNTAHRIRLRQQCLRFNCLRDVEKCDNFEPTNYDGPDPPCCVHVLRDLTRQFDRVMCYLGIEYFPAYGTLLGLTRSDRLIPWTSDNDYMVTKTAAAATEDLWDTASHINHGLRLFFDDVYRLCATPGFADGKLQRWEPNDTKNWRYKYPYADLYVVDELNETMVKDDRGCYHDVSSLRPTVRKAVYNGTVYQTFPANPDPILTEYYGPTWRTPDAKKSPHGNTNCARRRQRKSRLNT